MNQWMAQAAEDAAKDEPPAAAASPRDPRHKKKKKKKKKEPKVKEEPKEEPHAEEPQPKKKRPEDAARTAAANMRLSAKKEEDAAAEDCVMEQVPNTPDSDIQWLAAPVTPGAVQPGSPGTNASDPLGDFFNAEPADDHSNATLQMIEEHEAEMRGIAASSPT